jgi:beta-glucanase (GH16 family)
MSRGLINFISLSIFLVLVSCVTESDGSVTLSPQIEDPTITFSLASVIEGGEMVFEGRLSNAAEKEISFQYEIIGATAEPGTDFDQISGTSTIDVGERAVEIRVRTIDDDVNELDEKITFSFGSLVNVKADVTSYSGTIKDNDSADANRSGYETSPNHYGYDLTWGDEFEESIDMESFSFQIGDGCPDLCGWGNNELQVYTSEPENIFIRDGSLVIKALNEPPGNYTSTRMITKGKKEFTFGRIDIRAKLPEGQGIWPALWMLGANIDEVGWPNCGEIDIMELVGHEPNKTHATAHWGPQGEGSTYITKTKSFSENLSQDFHVYTLLWEKNSLKFYFDEELYHTITDANVTNTVYPFNSPFYLLFNVAVGGNWPGNPDDTTVFPQEMEIDYIRVFHEK